MFNHSGASRGRSLLRCGLLTAMAPGLLTLCSTGPAALAASLGPDWDENMQGDAGSIPSTAQQVVGIGTLSTIRGMLSVALDAPDYQDMYLIRIDCPAGITFKAGTDPSFGGSADFNTQLWLFDANGAGLLANNDVTPSMGLSGFGNASTDGTSIVVSTPGFYYIAVSGLGSVPVNSASLPLFTFISPMEVSGPDGPGGSSPIAGWSGTGAVGEYIIKFSTCAGFVPPPGCPADLDGNGVVDGADLGLLLAAWGAGNGPADLNDNGTVDGADLGILLAAWGACFE
jgi:hypothetical protein